jgi:RimJ/RimL family protein N-acetyltransferase
MKSPRTPPDALRDRVRAHLEASVDAASWALLGAACVTESVAAWLDVQSDRCTDLEWAATFAHHCPVPGVDAEAYLQRWVPVDGAWLLAGIRMRGGDVAHPFVDLLAGSEPVPLASALPAALAAYAAFRPVRARIRTSARPELPGGIVELDQVYVAASTRDLAADAELDLEPMDDAEEGARFVREGFEAWSRGRPWLRERVQPADREALEEARQEGLARWIVDGAQRVGLVATVPGTDREWSGHLVLEEVVHPDHAGRGWAARAQRSLARELVDRDVPVLFGTIDAANTPSRRTAAAAGRAECGALWWLEGPEGSAR